MSATPTAEHATRIAVLHYLGRLRSLLVRLSDQPDVADLLKVRLAPDMFETGLQLAIAIRFAARTLCPPAGQEAPQIPKERSCQTLLAYHDEVKRLLETIPASSLCRPVTHVAGQAMLDQSPTDYMLCFAFPNMLFHLSMAYAGLRHAGMDIGKADFDAMHAY